MPVVDGYCLQKGIGKHDYAGMHITTELLDYIGSVKKQQVRPRFTFSKKFVNVEGNEVVQLFDL